MNEAVSPLITRGAKPRSSPSRQTAGKQGIGPDWNTVHHKRSQTGVTKRQSQQSVRDESCQNPRMLSIVSIVTLHVAVSVVELADRSMEAK